MDHSNQHPPIIETHCHLDYLKSDSIPNIIKKSLECNVQKIITISVNPDNLNTVVDIANNYQQVLCTQGVHPHDARLFDDAAKRTIISNIKNEKRVIAVGEIGLDYHYDKSPRDIQKKVFEDQIQISIDHDLPIIIHSRESEDDTISILKNFRHVIKKPIAFHCFTSKRYLAEYVLNEGFYIGFNGIITFKAADNVREILDMTPISRILLETDAPFLSPLPYRGKENAPYYLPVIAKRISELKNVPLDTLLETVNCNVNDVFNENMLTPT